VDNHWKHIEDTRETVCADILAKKKTEQTEWMTHATWELIEHRKMLKQRLNHTQDKRVKVKRPMEYWNVNKEVKKVHKRRQKEVYTKTTGEPKQASRHKI